MEFWLTALAIASLSTAALVLALFRGRRHELDAARYDLQVYRDQLREVERDLARGVLGAADAERTRTEIARRVLEADRALQNATGTARAPRAATMIMALVVALVVLPGGLWLYERVGAPGYGDLPLALRKEQAEQLRKNRPSQAELEQMAATQMPDLPRNLELETLVTQLRKVMQERPDDIQGLTLLARNEAALGNFRAAHIAQSKLIALKGDQATGEELATLAELMTMATGGWVSPETEQVLRRAIMVDRTHPTTLYLSGLMLDQIGRPDLAFRYWRQLIETAPADNPWQPLVRGQIDALAWRAGVEYTPPPASVRAGPDADTMAAAAEMTPEERMEMIAGMVDGLSERLATEGGGPEEWAQLINALGVLGRTDQAREIYTEATQVFAANPGAMDQINAAAERVGLR